MYQIMIVNKIDENTLKCFVSEECSATPRKAFLLEEEEYKTYLDLWEVWREQKASLIRKRHIIEADLEFAKGVLKKLEQYEITDETSKEDLADMDALLKSVLPVEKHDELEGCT